MTATATAPINMASPRPSALNVTRASPFQRQPSASPAPGTTRATTPTIQASSSADGLLSGRAGSLSPEKRSPFARQSKQNSPVVVSPLNKSLNRPDTGIEATSTHHGSPTLVKRQIVEPVSPVDRQVYTPLETRVNEDPAQIMRPTTIANVPATFPHPSRVPLSSTNESQQRSTTMRSSPLKTSKPITPAGGFQHVPPALLRSMRESFEVLDSSNNGAIDSTAVASMLEQLGREASPSTLHDFFPADAPRQFNLARYLDTLSGQLTEISPAEELIAAFEAFDVDDSGQIDVAELRRALQSTVSEPGQHSVRLSERDIDSVLNDFTARRAFGSKGVNVAKGRGEVFRYRDFMASINGGVTETAPEAVGAL